MFLLFSDMLSAASFSVSAVIHLCAPRLLQHSSWRWHHPSLSWMAEGSEVSLTFRLAESNRQLLEGLGVCVRVRACVCACVCERDASGVCSPLTAFNSCNITNDTNLCSKLFVTAGYLSVLLQARWNELAWRQTDASWPRLSGAKTRGRWLASARALCGRRSSMWDEGLTGDRDKRKPAWLALYPKLADTDELIASGHVATRVKTDVRTVLPVHKGKKHQPKVSRRWG